MHAKDVNEVTFAANDMTLETHVTLLLKFRRVI